jgi:hypothetical protein
MGDYLGGLLLIRHLFIVKSGEKFGYIIDLDILFLAFGIFEIV